MKKLLLSLFTAFPFLLQAQQLVVSSNNVAQDLADYVTGPGITISNPTISCNAVALGLFSNGNSINLGLDSGVVLTTTQLSLITNTNSATGLGFTTGTTGNTLLNGIASPPCGGTYDACMLEFDIVPTCDSVKLKYVFASDEYNIFINSYSDVFGFFITGPNPAGGNYTNVPISLIPGTNIVVQATQVNNGTTNSGPCNNCQYYINNELALGGQPVAFAFNGLTTVLEATFVAVPGQTYHLTLGVQDCNDSGVDSGVFLEAEGLRCPDTTLTLSVSETQICEGQTITLFAGGLTNYTWSPVNDVNPTTGPIVNSTPSVTTTYVVSGTNIAGTFYTDSVTVTVYPAPQAGLLDVIGTDPVGNRILCEGDSAIIALNGSSGSVLTWQMSDNATTWTTISSGGPGDTLLPTGPLTVTTRYRAILEEGPCVDTAAPVTITILPKPTITATDAMICEGDSAQLDVNGIGNYTYSWTPPLALSSLTIKNPKAAPVENQVYHVTVTDDFGCTASDSSIVIVRPIPGMDYESNSSLCPNNDGSIQVTNTTGNGPFTYALNTTGFGTSTSFMNLAPGSYELIVRDSFGCSLSTPVVIGEYTDINASFTADPTTGYIPLTVKLTNTTSGNASTYAWDFGNGNSSAEMHPSTEYTNHGIYTITLTAFGPEPRCQDTAMLTIDARGQGEIALPNVFSPNGDGMNDVFIFRATNLVAYHLEIFDRWGRKVYESDDATAGWDGTRMGGAEASAGTYFFTLRYTTLEGIPTMVHNTVTLIR